MKWYAIFSLALATCAAGQAPVSAGGGPDSSPPNRYVASEVTQNEWYALKDRRAGANLNGQAATSVKQANGSLRAAMVNREGARTLLESLPSTYQSTAWDINNLGAVVGESEIYPSAPYGHATIWNPGSGPIEIGPMRAEIMSQALSINDSGDVVVTVKARDPAPLNIWGALWHADTLYRLDDLIDTPGVFVTDVEVINNAGYIGCRAFLNGNTKRYSMIKLTPVAASAVPEPGSIQLLMLGGAGIPLLRKRK